MKKQLLITGFIAIVVAVIAWRIYQYSAFHEVDDISTKRISKHSEQADSKTDVGEVKSASPEELLLEKYPRMKTLDTVQKLMNSEMSFYGKIIDQNGEPISGAHIEYNIAKYEGLTLPGMGWATKHATAQSGEDGRFVINEPEALHLNINAITKHGYVFSDNGRKTGIRTTPRYEGGAFYQPDPANPVIFHAWKKGYAAAELVDGVGFWGIKIDNEYHGLPIPETDKTIQIKFEQNPEGKWENVLDWSVRIKVEDGGVLPTEDVFMYEAPESGYKSDWSWVAPKHGDRWPIDTRQNFYFQTDNGSIYGRMEVRFIPYYGEKNQGVIDVKYWLNPTGSRNLLPADE